jgi:YD repeat-containing protein
VNGDRAALDGHVEQDVLGVVQTEYAVGVSAATPGYGDYEGSTVRVNGTPVYESHYEHDALGRITEWTETVEGSTRVQRFEYDDGGRLTSVRDGLDAPVADYGYDLNGNRTSVVEPDRVLELGGNLAADGESAFNGQRENDWRPSAVGPSSCDSLRE